MEHESYHGINGLNDLSVIYYNHFVTLHFILQFSFSLKDRTLQTHKHIFSKGLPHHFKDSIQSDETKVEHFPKNHTYHEGNDI